jgi:hypothetical protein
LNFTARVRQVGEAHALALLRPRRRAPRGYLRA